MQGKGFVPHRFGYGVGGKTLLGRHPRLRLHAQRVRDQLGRQKAQHIGIGAHQLHRHVWAELRSSCIERRQPNAGRVGALSHQRLQQLWRAFKGGQLQHVVGIGGNELHIQSQCALHREGLGLAVWPVQRAFGWQHGAQGGVLAIGQIEHGVGAHGLRMAVLGLFQVRGRILTRLRGHAPMPQAVQPFHGRALCPRLASQGQQARLRVFQLPLHQVNFKQGPSHAVDRLRHARVHTRQLGLGHLPRLGSLSQIQQTQRQVVGRLVLECTLVLGKCGVRLLQQRQRLCQCALQIHQLAHGKGCRRITGRQAQRFALSQPSQLCTSGLLQHFAAPPWGNGAGVKAFAPDGLALRQGLINAIGSPFGRVVPVGFGHAIQVIAQGMHAFVPDQHGVGRAAHALLAVVPTAEHEHHGFGRQAQRRLAAHKPQKGIGRLQGAHRGGARHAIVFGRVIEEMAAVHGAQHLHAFVVCNQTQAGDVQIASHEELGGVPLELETGIQTALHPHVANVCRVDGAQHGLVHAHIAGEHQHRCVAGPIVQFRATVILILVFVFVGFCRFIGAALRLFFDQRLPLRHKIDHGDTTLTCLQQRRQLGRIQRFKCHDPPLLLMMFGAIIPCECAGSALPCRESIHIKYQSEDP